MTSKKQKNVQHAKPVATKWSTSKFLIILAIVLIAGIAIGFWAGDGSVGTTDQYGRSPGDPHFGHSHP